MDCKIIEAKDMGQGTPAWHTWRKTGIGSSDAPALLNECLWKTADQVFQNKLLACIEAEKEKNSNQAYGTFMEPVAIKLYETWTGIKTRPVCCVNKKYPWLKTSLDGLSEDNDIILEVKCQKQEYHDVTLEGKVPRHYLGQLTHHCLVTGLKLVHFWSYNKARRYAPKDQVALVEFIPSEEYMKGLLKVEKEFMKKLRDALQGRAEETGKVDDLFNP